MGVNRQPTKKTERKNTMKLTTKQAMTVAVIARLYKRSSSIHLDDVRRMMQHKGILPKSCREQVWTYYAKNTSRTKAKRLGRMAYAVISAAEVLGLVALDSHPSMLACRWATNWPRTRRAERAELEANDFCEGCCAKLAAYLDDVDSNL